MEVRKPIDLSIALLIRMQARGFLPQQIDGEDQVEIVQDRQTNARRVKKKKNHVSPPNGLSTRPSDLGGRIGRTHKVPIWAKAPR